LVFFAVGEAEFVKEDFAELFGRADVEFLAGEVVDFPGDFFDGLADG